MWMSTSPTLARIPLKSAARRHRLPSWTINVRGGLWSLLGFVIFLGVWEAIARILDQPILIPSPQQTVVTAYQLLRDGIFCNR